MPKDSAASHWLRLFAIDLRSLALFRMAIALTMLGNVALRTVNFRTFYTDEGVWPVAEARAELKDATAWSLHLLNGSAEWEGALFACEAVAALALLLGWQTRVASILAWVLLASAQYRITFLNGGPEVLLRMYLFWAMWLPLGARWSLDAARRRAAGRGQEAEEVLSVASASLLLQVVLVYTFTAIYKCSPNWLAKGDAIWIALSDEARSLPLGRALLQWPESLRFLTRAIVAFEMVGPLFAFIPWATARWRIAVVGAFVTFHASLLAMMWLGLFPFVSIAGWLAFLPTEFWRGSPPGERARLRAPRLVNAAAAVCLLAVFAWNLKPWVPWLMPKPLAVFSHVLRFDQRWRMFAPSPPPEDFWIIMVGTDVRGRETNLLNGDSPVNWARPRDFRRFFPTHEWLMYYNVLARGNPPRRRLFAEWVLRNWRRDHPDTEPFVKVEIFRLVESIYHRGDVPDNYLIYEDPPSPSEEPANPEAARKPADSGRG